MTERLDVIHDRGRHVEAKHSRKVGRFDARICALALERFDQAGFFATDVGAGAAMNVDFNIETRAQHILPEEVVRACFLDRLLKNAGPLGKLASYIYVGGVDVESETGDEDAFNQLMRIFMNDIAILESARLRFVRVADQVNRLRL